MNNKAGFLILWAVWVLCMATACSGPQKNEVEEDCCGLTGEGFAFAPVHLTQSSSQCATDSSLCAHIRISYPALVRGPSAEAVALLNGEVEGAIHDALQDLVPGEETDKVPALEKLAAHCIAAYEAALAESPAFSVPWQVDIRGKILDHDLGVVSLQLDHTTFTGGAHAQTERQLMSFFIATGHRLALEDIVTNVPALRYLAEQRFRALRNIPANKDWQVPGFEHSQPFGLPENFAWTGEGLHLHYNALELAPSMMSSTDFTISKKALRPILRPHFAEAYERR